MATYDINNLPSITNLIDLNQMSASNVSISGDTATFQQGVTAMLTQNMSKPIANHKYYGRCLQLKASGSTESDARFEYFLNDSAQNKMTFAEFSNAPADGEYYLASAILSLRSPGDGQWVFRAFTVNASGTHKRKEFMLIDLTQNFGAGNEPSKEWCDRNIPFFKGTTVIPGINPAIGDIVKCQYSGAVKSISLPKGNYKLECWGASGGEKSGHGTGATGGYSSGELSLINPSNLFLVCGEKGSVDIYHSQDSTFNGGGKGGYCGLTPEGSATTIFASGGGATHIALSGGELYQLESNKNAVIIVAGGGAQKPESGATFSGDAYGGGLNGGNCGFGYNSGDGELRDHSTGGSQNAGGTPASVYVSGTLRGNPGSFGKGGDGSSYTNAHGPGGGGGWYGGGGGAAGWLVGGGNAALGGGGGSGYVADSGHAVGTVYLKSAKTLNPTESGFVQNPDTNKSGYIRITVKDIYGVNIRGKHGGDWKTASHCYAKKSNAWHEIESIYCKVNGVWKECGY